MNQIPREESVFNYFDDVTIKIGNNSYSVQNLLDMNDSDYQLLYTEYQNEIGEQLKDNQKNSRNGLATMGTLSIINLMERVRLERRIFALENKE
jgi:hypothetical protein